MKKPIYFKFVILIAFSSFFVECGKKNKKEDLSKKTGPPAVVDVIIAQNQSISSISKANGSILANEFVELRPEVSGRIIYLNIPEGTTIKKGTILARINDADLQAQLNKTNIQLDLSKKQSEDYPNFYQLMGLVKPIMMRL